MKGLRTVESEPFLKFFAKVQSSAEELGKVFFLDFGDCKGDKFLNMEIDDLCGWLVPISESEEFEKEFKAFESLEQWDDFITWCLPQKQDGSLSIKFKQF
ncbi:MAG: hypothetical protein Q4P08_03805 [Eubacteriales bacterium]|nr:hypothetical protein [Eubacteriales bacterium]